MYLTALWLVHYVAKSTSHAFAMRASERYSPHPFPTHELCRDHSGQVTCNRARMGIGTDCQNRCVILSQQTAMSKFSPYGTKVNVRTQTR